MSNGRHGKREKRPLLSDRLTSLVIVVVLAVWVINFGAALLVDSYQPSESVNAIFGIIVAALYAKRASGNSEDR